MNKKLLVVIGALAIAVVSVGNFAIAQDSNQDWFRNMERRVEAPYRNGHCGGEEMTAIMRENGFEDMAKAMEERDFEAKDKFMQNMTEEDYNKMMEIMAESGYGNMTRKMESLGIEGMRDMHSFMMGGRRNRFNN